MMVRKNGVGNSWVGLIGFCVTSTFAVAIIFAVALATATLTFAGEPKVQAATDDSSAQTFAGVISDSYCHARHDRNSKLSSGECTRVCVQRGAKYEMVNGDKIYLLDGDIADLNGFAGQRVEVKGVLEGNTIHFTEIGFLTAEQ